MAVPTFAQMMAQTNPNGIGFGGGSAGLTVQSTPTTAGVSNGYGGSQLPQGTPSFGSGPSAQQQAATQQAAANQQAQAQAAAQAQARANAQANINNGVNSAVTGGMGNIDLYGNNLGAQGAGLATSHETAITGDNTDRQNINMNKLASLDDLQNTIRQGLNTSQLGMGNGNAMASSGAEGAARAYSEFGAHGANTVNGQANLGLTQDDAKDKLADLQLSQGLESLDSSKAGYLAMIKGNVESALNSLASQAQQQGLSPVDVAGHVQQILDAGNARFNQIDQDVSNRSAAVAPISNDQSALTAAQQYHQGFTPTNGSLFSYGLTPATNPLFTQPTQPGAGLAPIAALPLFTKNQNG